MRVSRRQVNVRIDDETSDRLERVQAAGSASLGLRLSISDVFRLGLVELERKYPSTPTSPTGAAKGRRKKG
jgi:hypothetical protein